MYIYIWCGTVNEKMPKRRNEICMNGVVILTEENGRFCNKSYIPMSYILCCHRERAVPLHARLRCKTSLPYDSGARE